MKNESSCSRASLSEEQILNLGQMAAEAFKNPIFKIIHDKLQAQYFQQWLGAPPDHTKEMAFLKAKHVVLGEILQDMTGLIDHANRVYAEMQERNSTEAQEKRRLDEQGFGLNFGQGGVS